MRNWKRWMGAVVVAAAAAVGATVEVAPVLSNSMAPTLHVRGAQRTTVVVEKLSLRLGSAARFDVVTFEDPSGSGRILIKRVIGLAGERVEVRGGVLRVGGKPLALPEGVGPMRIAGGREGAWDVPAGRVFLMGDNGPASVDSRVFGAVAESSLIGRMVAHFGG